MSLTQIIIGLIIIVLLLIGLIVFVSKVVFQYKKNKMENEMFLRVQRRKRAEELGVDEDTIDKIFKPVDFKARTDVSRPFPRPLITTSIFSIPKSKAFNPAFLAALCAANGVFLRAPLKPELPDEAQQTVFPNMSLIVTIVLLNVVFMFATPTATDFFCFFFAFVFAIKYYLFSSCK